ncbi:hypothetical protein J4H19_23340, partial [Vibrio alginolyticus]|uniref:hypothetical protein n=1 Tax=Vibrio alginolyticus TaxID=663 RepID=UPI001BD3968A
LNERETFDFAGLISLPSFLEKMKTKSQEHLNVFFGVYLSINIENFTNNNKLLFCQLSKLLKSYVSYKLALVNYQSVWTLIVSNHRIRR